MDNDALEAATKSTTAAAAAAAVSPTSAPEAAASIKIEPATTNNNNNKVTTAANGIKENNSNFSTTTTATATTSAATTSTTPIVVTSGIVATPIKSEANKTDKDSTPPRDAPPPTQITKGLNLTTTPLMRKEKRQSSTRYNVSKNCELTALSPLNENAINKIYA